MPNSGPGGCPGTRVMTIFGFQMVLVFVFVLFFENLRALGGIPSFFSLNFMSNGVSIISGDLFLTRVMTICIKKCISAKVELGDSHG